MAFLDNIFGEENKLKQEIKSLELRRESVFTAINGEIASLENQKRELFLTVGTRLYDAWKDKKEDSVNFEDYWTKVQELEKQIEEQEKKRVEMGERYNEEINLIRNTIAMNQAAAAAPQAAPQVVPDVLKCPKCGVNVRPTDAFCQNCGNKLK